MIHTLNRIRLRLGLFFWRNYAWIEEIADCDHYSVESRVQGEYCTVTATIPVTYAIHWPCPGALSSIIDAKAWPSRTEAIAHIRARVKSGRIL